MFFLKASPMLGFSFRGSEREASTAWTERKPWEIAHGESFAGRERAAWTDRKPWEIVWGELRWEGARRRNFYTPRNSYTETFTQKNLDTEKLSHTETFTRRSFYAKKLLRTEAFTHRSFYTLFFHKRPLHRGAFAHCYAQTSLHTVAFTHRNFYTEKSSHIFHHVSSVMIIQDIADAACCGEL